MSCLVPVLTSGTSTLTKSQVVSQIWRTPIFLDKQLLLLCKWCKIKEKDIPWIISSKNLFLLIILLFFLKGNPNSTYLQSVMESYGFPTSKAGSGMKPKVRARAAELNAEPELFKFKTNITYLIKSKAQKYHILHNQHKILRKMMTYG